MPETDKSEKIANALLFELPEFQVNGDHQESDQADAHSQTDLTVLVFLARFADQGVGTLNGLFTRHGHLLKKYFD